MVEQETKTAQLEAAKQQQLLVATVIRPAEAQRDADIAAAQAASRVAELTAEGQAKRTTLEAEAKATATRATGLADADAIRARGSAEGDAIQARGLAEAASISARADALATNPEAVAMQGLAERWPEVVREAAGAFAHVQNFTVLDGDAGVNRAIMDIASSGMASFESLRGLFVPKPVAAEIKSAEMPSVNGVHAMSATGGGDTPSTEA